MSIYKKIDGEDRLIADKSIIDHSELSGREAYGAHPISAIRKLPEKLHALKEKDAELERKLVEHDTEADNKIKELEEKDRLLVNKADYIEKHSQQIDTSVDENLTLWFRDYGGKTHRYRTGYLPDDNTLKVNEDNKLAIKRVVVDEETITGTGNQFPLELKNKPDEDTIITDKNKHQIYSSAIRDEHGKITPQHIRDKETEYEDRFGAVTNELKRQDEVDTYQKSLIDDLQSRTRGIGGWLDAYDFGKNPTQKDLTDYALQDIGITDANEIFNGTRVKNLSNGDIWIWDKETQTWSNNGPDRLISDANNDGIHGIVTGSYAPYKGLIGLDGTITINGVEDEDKKLNKRIDEHEEWAEEKFTHYVTLDTDQSIHNAKTFEEDITLNKNLNIDGNINPSDNVLDIDGTVKPTTNNTYDLGSQTEQYKDLYLAGNLSNGNKTINVEHIANIDDLAEAREIALKYRGNYDSFTQYDLHDVVLYNGLYYLSLLDNNVLAPDYDSDSVWCCLDRYSINADKAKVVEKANTKAYLVGDTTNTDDYKNLSRDSQVYAENGELYDKRGVVSSKEYVDEQIKSVTSDSQESNTQLRSDLDDEIRNREKGDSDLKSALDTETENRTNADTTLQQNINNEQSARETKDTELENKIDKEIQDRTDGDKTLTDRLDNLKTSEIENDGDGTSPFATQEYVDKFGGKIDSISVNGKENKLPIDENKNVDITIPTKTSELTNDGDGEPDAKYATQEYVVNLVSTNTARYLTASADSDVMSAIFTSFDAVKAGPWYRNGKETTPTNNDYATFEYHRMVEGSEIPQHEYWRAIYQVDYETGEGAWSVQSKLGSMLTLEQQKALDSGITETLVKQITTNKNDIANLKTKTDTTNAELNELKTNLENNYYTKTELYTQQEVDDLFKKVSSVKIRRWA